MTLKPHQARAGGSVQVLCSVTHCTCVILVAHLLPVRPGTVGGGDPTESPERSRRGVQRGTRTGKRKGVVWWPEDWALREPEGSSLGHRWLKDGFAQQGTFELSFQRAAGFFFPGRDERG